MNGLGINLFWIPKEVAYYVVIPMVTILVIYLVFSLIYRRKKGTLYYDYVVDFVFSTLGIIFCALLFTLILGYSIATIRSFIINRIIGNYIPLVSLLVILPIIPFCFFIYVLRVFFKNLKRKKILDEKKDESDKNVEIKEDTSELIQDEIKEDINNFSDINLEEEENTGELKENINDFPDINSKEKPIEIEQGIKPIEELEVKTPSYEDVELVKKK